MDDNDLYFPTSPQIYNNSTDEDTPINMDPIDNIEETNQSLDAIDSFNQSNYDKQMNSHLMSCHANSNSNFLPELDIISQVENVRKILTSEFHNKEQSQLNVESQ